MADIFLSYATEDRARAKSLAESLELRGWAVWWDKKIPLGTSFDQVIEEAIGAARCVIVLWSRASVSSEWVRNEASEGKRRGILIPVFLDAVDAPLAFRLLNGADLSTWQAGMPHGDLDKLTERVAQLLAQAGDGNPSPVPSHTIDQPGLAPGEPRLRRRWLLIGSVSILVVTGVLSAGYMIGTQWGSSTSAKAGDALPQGDTEKPAAAASATDIPGIDQVFGGGALDAGLLGGVTSMTMVQLPELGLHIAFIPPEQAETFRGAGLPPGAVISVVESGPAQAAGVHSKDVIVAVNGQKITTMDDLRRVVKGIGPGKSRYLIRRGEATLTLEIDCPTCTVT